MTQNPFCIRLKSVFLTADFALLLHNHIYNIFRTGVQETARRFSSLLFTLLFTVALPTCAHAASSITSEDQGSAAPSGYGWDSPTTTALQRQVHKNFPRTGRPFPQRGCDTPYHGHQRQSPPRYRFPGTVEPPAGRFFQNLPEGCRRSPGGHSPDQPDHMPAPAPVG